MCLKNIKKKGLLILTAMVLVFPAAAFGKSTRTYSLEARNNYSENDVKAFVYNWFAGFYPWVIS